MKKRLQAVMLVLLILPLSAFADLCSMYKKQAEDYVRYTIFMSTERGHQLCVERCKLYPVYKRYAELVCAGKPIPRGLKEDMLQKNDKECRDVLAQVIEIGHRIPTAGYEEINCYYKIAKPRRIVPVNQSIQPDQKEQMLQMLTKPS